MAVTAEEWDEAAALEDRIKELSAQSAAAGGAAVEEERRAAMLSERRQDLASQKGKVGTRRVNPYHQHGRYSHGQIVSHYLYHAHMSSLFHHIKSMATPQHSHTTCLPQVWDSASAYLRHLGQRHEAEARACEASAAQQARELEVLERQHGQVGAEATRTIDAPSESNNQTGDFHHTRGPFLPVDCFTGHRFLPRSNEPARPLVLQVSSAVSEARCALALRRTELAASRSDLDGRMSLATGSLQQDQRRLQTSHAELEVRDRGETREGGGGRWFEREGGVPPRALIRSVLNKNTLMRAL